MFTFIVINSSGYCVISKCRLEWSFQSKVQVRNSQGESRAFVWCHPATIPKGQKWSGRNQRTTAWPYPETNRRIWDATDASHLSMYPATGWNRPAASSVLHSRLHWPDKTRYRKNKFCLFELNFASENLKAHFRLSHSQISVSWLSKMWPNDFHHLSPTRYLGY